MGKVKASEPLRHAVLYNVRPEESVGFLTGGTNVGTDGCRLSG